jgi:hypothetical protein
MKELVRGPNKGDGPDTSQAWEVLGGQAHKPVPCLRVRNSNGDVYVIKFDLPDYPELASSAEAISTKFFYAAGYNTPENYITVFDPEKLRIEREVEFIDKRGVKRTMGQEDLTEILNRVARKEDGKIRAMASRQLTGIPKGPFSFKGTRRDDPVDTVQHEDRRELRGLGILCSWLNHVDAVETNTLDMYVEESGNRYLKHYLTDFGSTMGSGTDKPKGVEAGYEYAFDFAEVLKCLFTFGIYRKPWQDTKPIDLPSVGRFESELFDPGDWKPYFPNPAFQKITNLDGYWGAKIVASFSDEQIEAVVRDVHYTNPAVEAYLIEILKQRRDKLMKYWYSRVNPLDGFTIREDRGGKQSLHFKDLAVVAGIYGTDQCEYRYRIYRHDFEEGTELLTEYASAACPIALDEVVQASNLRKNTPEQERMDTYFFLEIESKSGEESPWGKYVRVHLHREQPSGRFSVAGVEHEG